MVNLLTPISIGSAGLRNRIVLPPMQTGLAGEGGEVTDELVDHYRNYSSHVGLVIVEHSYVVPGGKYSSGQLGIHDDGLTPGLAELAGAIAELGATSLIQLNHAGLKAGETELNLLDYDYQGSLTKYSREKFDEILEGFVEAGRRALEAGFDGVEVHGAHGFLLSQFLSPITNDREDEYGGTFRNRSRFPLKVVEGLKRRIGDGLLAFRLGATDLDNRGVTIEDSKRLAKELETKGVDLIDVSGGLCGSDPEELAGEEGYFVKYARQVKEAADLPVIGVGGIEDPAYANKIIKSGQVDLVAVGRAQLSDPDWAEKAVARIRGDRG